MSTVPIARPDGPDMAALAPRRGRARRSLPDRVHVPHPSASTFLTKGRAARSPKVPLVLALAAPLSCAGETERTVLTLAATYDAIGAARFFPAGASPIAFREIHLVFDNLEVDGARVLGEVEQVSSSVRYPFAADFDARSGEMVVTSLETAALTGTAAEERILELGGRADDVLPKDGVADELSGFIETVLAGDRVEGIYLGTARASLRPPAPDTTRIRIRRGQGGLLLAEGDPGAALGSIGIEIFRFALAMRDPILTLGQAREDGGFSIAIEGDEDDLFIVRGRAAGIASQGHILRVAP